MSEHTAIIEWNRVSEDFKYAHYNRNHKWKFDSGIIVDASSAIEFMGNPECVDPEEAFTASLSSCHMLTFLAIASKNQFVVDQYIDHAKGYLEKNQEGKLYIKQIILNPKILFGGNRTPADLEIKKMHENAHHNCFIANSVITKVEIKIG